VYELKGTCITRTNKAYQALSSNVCVCVTSTIQKAHKKPTKQVLLEKEEKQTQSKVNLDPIGWLEDI